MSERMTGGLEMSPVTHFPLGELAKGTIEAREDQQDRFEEFTQRVGSGEFHIHTTDTVASACIDGRCGGVQRPDAAGGTATLVVAYDLLSETDLSFLSHYDFVAANLKDLDLPVGGHDDSNANENKCGCGACDRIAEIYDFMAKNADALRDVTTSLGISVNDEIHVRMQQGATRRTDFATGPQLRQKIEDHGGTVDHLRGEHNEVIAIINMRKGTTLDRDAVEAEFGPNYEAFNIDAWTFEEAARAIVGDDEQAINDMVAAQIRYNLATANVLCGKNMPVIVLT